VPRGSAPGERRGGRQKGSRNKRTREAALIASSIAEKVKAGTATKAEIQTRAMVAAQEIQRANEQRTKLAKEYLEEFTVVLYSMAARYQLGGTDPNEAKYKEWLKMAIDCATKLAPYQSPTFRAIVVAPPPPSRGEETKRFTLTIFDNHNEGREATAIAMADSLDLEDEE
jgi:hypothetical protein